MKAFSVCACVSVGLLWSQHVVAATLRPSGVVHGASVYLSDVFEGLESGQDRLLGPAPAPGKAVTIGGSQLIALADQYGVDWDDQSSSASLTLTRAGHVLGRDDFVALVRKMVAQDEGASSVVVEITSFTPVIVEEGQADPVILSNLEWDHKTGRFTALVQPTHPSGTAGADSFTLRGTIRPVQPVMVYDHALAAGHIIQQDDMRIDPAFTGTIPPLARSLPEPEKMVGMALVRTVAAGQPVEATDLRRAILVHRGDPVLLSYNSTGIRLTATGRALEDGGSGQFVHALNLGSRMILIGRVSASGEIRVDASSTAIPPDSEEARRLGINTMMLDGGSRP
ncbi:flagellar basal body P-ring formation chaperone FlgA [Bombella saccharophila]|uniref:Flagellar basal body P-ring formation chaperone FlgA n=1 Tax=Bombella saccharophila TaxID=2967338 RepID=A0ABT3W955_9PROT|nr:flagellar basal body P-ring formation chaperone FlgA [Bombella saccharophila]MCX5614929.1 flagellar basal body P-ring formation chaperone FlgA [Bombella saccharophila]